MKNLKTQVRVTLVLGVLALLAVGMSHLALTDIYHGEADVSLEWTVVRVSAAVVLAFVGLALFTLRRMLGALS